MSNYPKKPAADPPSRPLRSLSHKYSIGSVVVLSGGSDQTAFKITRHLPDGGSGPQYRIKSERENYERVTTESRLTPLSK
ncbi:hypothetical protein K9U39_04580 [Rhodoblastus acidophilus]|uniref:Uncharacterized protein n=1 Tax=Candidatus Rhodoblastus alkanivorans TaxID=2954117 RepID=A0ABS9Z5N2_9HYPH|nr:hypothetical protein [Candidatus Rhodoblastus alkanivorans]MCI4678410.1 hypothetical protein [Candidatus Rhodoblastus alkanivorans]MCI4682917.1 hypothetical protein [Candidatus Rhodoblastus alkanivorans]MDI4640227.1 hypothetical protein [Rhodoblastus acidophilus]